MEGFPIIKSRTDTRQYTVDANCAKSTGLKLFLPVLEYTVNVAYVQLALGNAQRGLHKPL